MIAPTCRFATALAVALTLAGPFAFGQPASDSQAPSKAIAKAPLLSIVDEAGALHELTPKDLAGLPRQSVVVEEGGRKLNYEGVALIDVLRSAGVGFGDQLKGRRAAAVADLEATDGYHTAFALLEFDPATTDKIVVVADRCDGKPLIAPEGPLRLIAPGEKRKIRWIRMLKTIRVTNAAHVRPGAASSADVEPQTK